MSKVTISSKGQITIPVSFRRHERFADVKHADIQQAADGTITIRPPVTVEQLAGRLKLKRPLSTPREERKAFMKAMAASAMKGLR